MGFVENLILFQTMQKL